MKIFLSWSGAKSQATAEVFREWLPKILQASDPWLSSQDIEKGTTWLDSIYSNIQDSNGLGLFFLTRTGQASPWLLFEAGAIAGLGLKRVCVVLVDIAKHEVTPPLRQFQSTSLEKDDVRSLVANLAGLLPRSLPETVWGPVFEWAWPQISQALEVAKAIETSESPGTAVAEAAASTHGDTSEILAALQRVEARLGNVERQVSSSESRSAIARALADVAVANQATGGLLGIPPRRGLSDPTIFGPANLKKEAGIIGGLLADPSPEKP